MSLPLRLYSRSASPAAAAMARTPSHLNSKAQPGPDGGAPAEASIGATGPGSSDLVAVITSQLALTEAPAPAPTGRHIGVWRVASKGLEGVGEEFGCLSR